MPKAWRTGRKVGRTIYEMDGDTPSDDDRLIGMLDSSAISEGVVLDHNLVRGFGPTAPSDRAEVIAKDLWKIIEQHQDVECADDIFTDENWIDLNIESERDVYRELAGRVLGLLGASGGECACGTPNRPGVAHRSHECLAIGGDDDAS